MQAEEKEIESGEDKEEEEEDIEIESVPARTSRMQARTQTRRLPVGQRQIKKER